jgi:hypothetical protein
MNYQQPPQQPRPAPPPSPGEPTDFDRQMVKLDRKIRNSMVLIVVFVIFFIIIGIASVTLHEASYDGTVEEDRSEYGFEFSVQSVTGSLPVKMEVTASHKVDYFFVMTKDEYEIYKDEDEFETRMTNYEQNSEYSVQDTSKFTLDKDLPVDDYVIVTASQERSYSVSVEYKITRYYIQPLLIFILLIFVIIWIVIAIRIYKLQQKKQDLEFQEDQFGPGYQQGYYDSYGQPYQPQAAPPQQTYYQQQPPPQHSLQAPPQGRVYGSQGNPDQPRVLSGPTPMDTRPPRPPRRRRPPPPPPPGAKSNPGNNYEPLVVTCKCGGSIPVNSPERPVEIQCPKCGRKGVVEAANEDGQSDGEEVHYY